MAFLAYLVVLIFAGGAAMFGLDLITAPLPQHHTAPPTLSTASKPNKVARREADADRHDVAANSKELTPVYPTNPGGVREVTADKAPSVAPAVAPTARETTGAAPAPTPSTVAAEVPAPEQKPVVKTAPTVAPPAIAASAAPAAQTQPSQAVAQQSIGHCDVQACASAYHSFRASDCTYQPYEGSRRACIAPPARQARNDAGLAPVSPQSRRASMAPRQEELRQSQSNNNDDEYDDDDDDDGSVDYNANAYAPANGYPESVVVIRRPRGW